MKKIKIFLLVLLVLAGVLYAREQFSVDDTQAFKNGDIIFQTSTSSQSRAIQLATHSKYSHCGLLFRENNQLYVFEAIQPVQKTPFAQWVKRGKNGTYVVKRLKDEKVLTPEVLAKMQQIGKRFAGKNYDLTFEWSDDRIYCSELVWKIYQRAAGIEVGRLQKLKDFDLSSKAVQAKMKARYGNRIPKNETVISPAAIFESELLETVRSR
ncbi:YiiX family permuted papain-like enzyme [Flavobacterium sp.]|uniref:YiiX family permuted papain-like enzyme n=1 Tax=Flavobacterium sp. TaxID=239 RepID=UPI0039E67CDD